MKTSILNTRVSTSTKEELEILSSLTNQPISNIVRESIENYLDTYLSTLSNTDLKIKDLEVLRSLGFTELIFWIYTKHTDPDIDETYELYEQFINLIEELNSHPLFTSEILVEFNKISNELRGVLNNSFCPSWTFKFPESFDYAKLFFFIHGLRYDCDNNKVIHIK